MAGADIAIVTDIEGTTRDIVKEKILIDGMPVHIIDTAGLRESADTVEQIGIKRALEAIENADDILWVKDSNQLEQVDISDVIPEFKDKINQLKHLTVINNKCDLSGLAIGTKLAKVRPLYMSYSFHNLCHHKPNLVRLFHSRSG